MDMQTPSWKRARYATRKIRENRRHTRRTDLLAMTANAFPAEDRARRLGRRTNDFIVKPVDPDQVFATLLKWLEQRATSSASA